MNTTQRQMMQQDLSKITALPCDNCGRPVSTTGMPGDWPYDWWTHQTAGQKCSTVRPAI